MKVIKANNITVPTPTDGWLKKLRTSLAAFAPSGDPVTTLLNEDYGGGHCVYSVGLKKIEGLKKLDEINTPLYWRFLAQGADTATGAACLATHESSKLPAKVMAALNGPEVADILKSAENLNHLKEVRGKPNNHYELRVLRMPALSVEAFWLKSLTGKPEDDLIVPYGLVVDGSDSIKLPGGKTQLKKDHAYPVAEFLEMMQGAARHRRDADDKAPQARYNRSLMATGRPFPHGTSRAAGH